MREWMLMGVLAIGLVITGVVIGLSIAEHAEKRALSSKKLEAVKWGEVEGYSSTVMFYYKPEPGEDMREGIIFDCTDSQYTFAFEEGVRFYVLRLPSLWTHCYVNRPVYWWPRFQYRLENGEVSE
jgi:hypothetical protein